MFVRDTLNAESINAARRQSTDIQLPGNNFL